MVELNGLSEIEQKILNTSEGWTLCSPLNKHLLMESVRYIHKIIFLVTLLDVVFGVEG